MSVLFYIFRRYFSQNPIDFFRGYFFKFELMFFTQKEKTSIILEHAQEKENVPIYPIS